MTVINMGSQIAEVLAYNKPFLFGTGVTALQKPLLLHLWCVHCHITKSLFCVLYYVACYIHSSIVEQQTIVALQQTISIWWCVELPFLFATFDVLHCKTTSVWCCCLITSSICHFRYAALQKPLLLHFWCVMNCQLPHFNFFILIFVLYIAFT